MKTRHRGRVFIKKSSNRLNPVFRTKAAFLFDGSEPLSLRAALYIQK
jgi:hypothetical protein